MTKCRIKKMGSVIWGCLSFPHSEECCTDIRADTHTSGWLGHCVFKAISWEEGVVIWSRVGLLGL